MRLAAICAAGSLLACSADPSTPAPADAVLEDEARWLHVSSLGVALSSFPGRSVLLRTLQVRASQGRTDVPWTAESDRGWLSVTPSGLAGGELTLMADPAGLPPGPHLAQVRVRSPDGAIVNEQTVRVGLWIGTTAPTDVTITGTVPHVVASPVEPYVYTNTAGTDITAYNVYSGAVARTFPSAVGRAGSMAVSSDGTILFVDDDVDRHVVALDTRTGTELRRYAWGASSSRGIGYARPNAHPVLMIGTGRVFDVESGRLYAATINDGGYTTNLTFDIDLHSQHVYVQNHGIGPSTLRQYAIGFNTLGTDPLIVRKRGERNNGGSYGQGICVSADGSQVYAANSAPYNFPAYAADGLMPIRDLPGDAYPNNVACGWNGLFFGSATPKVWVYRLDGTPVTTLQVISSGEQMSGTLVLSGDNTRIMASSGGVLAEPAFNIRNAPSP